MSKNEGMNVKIYAMYMGHLKTMEFLFNIIAQS